MWQRPGRSASTSKAYKTRLLRPGDDDPMTDTPVNLTQALAAFTDVYSPRIVGRVNDYDIRIAHVRGEHVWHVHEHTDEFFLVLDGQVDISLRQDGGERTVTLHARRDLRGAEGHRAQTRLARRRDPDVRAIRDAVHRRPARG